MVWDCEICTVVNEDDAFLCCAVCKTVRKRAPPEAAPRAPKRACIDLCDSESDEALARELQAAEGAVDGDEALARRLQGEVAQPSFADDRALALRMDTEERARRFLHAYPNPQRAFTGALGLALRT